MASYNDPQEVHGDECPQCQRWFRDNETDLTPSGICYFCDEVNTAAAAQEAADDAAAELEWAAAQRQYARGVAA